MNFAWTLEFGNQLIHLRMFARDGPMELGLVNG